MEKDVSICKWSVQENKMCPYNEMLSMIINSNINNKVRCEGKECLKVLKEKTGLKEEKEIVKYLAPDYLKPYGPSKTRELLSNFNIEDVLKDFSVASAKKNTQFTNGPFYHVSFEMCDFMKSNFSELRDLDFDKLSKLGFKTFGCVLNTDKWSGRGKHWVCIFGKINGKKIRVEYFNSSGRKVTNMKGLLEWCRKKNEEGYDLKIKNVVPEDGLQKNNTECGVWCLCYIKSRLENYPDDFFIKDKIRDKDIIEARAYLFND